MERNAPEFHTTATSAGLCSIYLCTHYSHSVDSGKEIPDMKLLNIISRFSSWRLEFTLPPLISDLKLLCDPGMDVLTVCGEYDRTILSRTSHPSGGGGKAVAEKKCLRNASEWYCLGKKQNRATSRYETGGGDYGHLWGDKA